MNTLKDKLNAVELVRQGLSYRQASRLCNASYNSIRRWRRQLEGSLEELYTFIGVSERKECDLGLSNEELENLPNDLQELKKIIFDLTFENDFKEEILEIVKKDLGVDLKRLKNSKKAQLVDALSKKRPFSIGWMMSSVGLAPATFYYHKKKRIKDNEEELRTLIKMLCSQHPRWGYRRIKYAIEQDSCPLNNVSEKTHHKNHERRRATS